MKPLYKPYKRFFLFFFAFLFSYTIYAAPMMADEAFKVDVQRLDPNTAVLNWDIAPGYFLYRDRIQLESISDTHLDLSAPRLPEAQSKIDSRGKVTAIYRDKLAIPVSILGKAAGETVTTLQYQGCADDGFCYPPEKRQLKLTINNGLELSAAEIFTPITGQAVPKHPVDKPVNHPVRVSRDKAPSTDGLEMVFLNHHWLITLVIFYGFGLLLAFTPCVLPMVPVLSGIIIGHGHTISTRKAFLLSLAYVFSMAMTYAIVGAIVASLGANLQMAMQSPWIIGAFSLVFVLLAISMFGFFELKLPTSWQAKLASMNRSQASGHYLSAALMGTLSTLILSPCVTAPLIGALSYIANTGNVMMGACTLFALGLGMGTPLLLIGTSARHWLPKAGHWMNAVKFFFGILLLAVAIQLLSRVVSAGLSMGLWAILLVFTGVFIGALGPAVAPQDKAKQAAGLLLLVYGVLVLIGASLGSSDPLLPLAPLTKNGGFSSRPAEISSFNVSNLAQLKKTMKRAHGQSIMLDFYAKWCETCKKIESTAFKDSALIQALGGIVVIKIDVTDNTPEDQAMLKYFKVVAPPTFLWFDGFGKELPQLRLVGDLSSADFLSAIAAVNSR